MHPGSSLFFFFNDTATTEIYTLSLHDALPIAFLVVTSLIARAIERHVMRLDQLAVSTRVGVSKFAYFLLLGLGMLLGINDAGVDVTTLNVLTGAIGLGLGFGLQSVASSFVSGLVLLMDKSIKPGDVISFTTGTSGASAGTFGWVQELRGRYVVVRDRDGVDTLVPNQNLITSPFINWSYSDQRVRLKLPVTVSYDDDPEVALQLLLQAAENHPRILIVDRKSTRLNSSHLVISYAVFCLKKKTASSTISTISSS